METQHIFSFQSIIRNFITKSYFYRSWLIIFGIPSIIHTEQPGFRRNGKQLTFHRILPFTLKTGSEYTTDIAVALSFGSHSESATQGTVGIQTIVCLDAEIMIFGSGNRCQAQVRTFGNTRQVILLLFGATPQFTTERHPSRIKRHISTVTQFHYCHAVVKVIGRNTFYTASSHCHCGISLKARHTEEWNQGSGNILTYTASVSVIHFRIMQGISLPFTHRDAGIADIICHPMGKYSNLFHFSLLAFNKFIHLLLSFRQWSKTAIVFIHLIEP